MKMVLHKHELKLKHRFKIAHDSRDVQKTLIVELRNGIHSGYGEATASNYYQKSIESIEEILESNREIIESYDYEDPSFFWEQLHQSMGSNYFALCAVDVAVHDLLAKRSKQSLREYWKLNGGNHPQSSYTIGIDSVENMIKKILEFPWSNYKIKLGTKEDIRIVTELRKVTNAIFRVDANCGWTVDETLRNAHVLKELNVEFIEQPLPAEDWEGMSVLYKKSVLPLIADESCQIEVDISKCYQHFHGINIKLMKCGGFTPARRMISKSKSLGMKIMLGCMTESSVGISAMTQLLSLLDYVDMDGFLLISNDVGIGPKLVGDNIELPTGPGIGVQIKEM
ncbi:MAG: dipeptide epimerase [Cyclobacteriaceae bacterium]|nr:dipeptide epimerase [Cyclobacteriaceae bacterium HetDA_MAG_MS6]